MPTSVPILLFLECSFFEQPRHTEFKLGVECFKCGKLGYMKYECMKNRKETIVATLKSKEDMFYCYSRTFVDSGSSVHTVADLNLLDSNTIKITEREVSSVNGINVKLTHVGSRTIITGQGMVVMSKEVYFAKELKYNLMSVPAMVAKGVTVILRNSNTYLEKKGKRINLENVDGLWAVPETKSIGTVASNLTCKFKRKRREHESCCDTFRR